MPEPGSAEWYARVAALEEEESKQPLGWWYLSFADSDGWKGGVIVRARGMLNATDKVNMLGINPGGEIRAIQLGPKLPPRTPKEAINRLLSKADMDKLMGGVKKW